MCKISRVDAIVPEWRSWSRIGDSCILVHISSFILSHHQANIYHIYLFKRLCALNYYQTLLNMEASSNLVFHFKSCHVASVSAQWTTFQQLYELYPVQQRTVKNANNVFPVISDVLGFSFPYLPAATIVNSLFACPAISRMSHNTKYFGLQVKPNNYNRHSTVTW